MNDPLPSSPVDRRSFLKRATIAGGSCLALSRLGTEPESQGAAAAAPLRVRVWCEGTAPRAVYPDDIDGALGDHLTRQPGLVVRRSRLTDAAAGLSDETLDATDVLIWWGHLRHDDVPVERAEAVVRRVREGKLGLVALHSSCASRPFKVLMKMSCEPGGWREDGQPEQVSVKAPGHPIARGVGPFKIARSDMFTEPFAVPPPQDVVLMSTWEHGESVRSGMTWTVDKGRVVYLRTGLDTFPVMFHPMVRLLIANASVWAGRRS